jgi:hypothetical protein
MIDLGLAERSLAVDGWAPHEPPPWLLASWQDAPRFFAELAAWHDAMNEVPLRSVAQRHYDLFHDLVSRHVALATPALAWYAGDGTRCELSFAELALLASRRAEAWRQAGARAGQVVALTRVLSPELIVSLLAAIKLGLVFSIVPPSGRRLAQARLSTLAPALVDADALHGALVPAGALLLPSQPSPRLTPTDEPPHLYRAGAPLGLLFDPAGPSLLEPRPLTCDAAWLGALRDGAVTLGLRASDAVAAPDLSLLATQPALLLATLMSGATFVHLTLDELERAPERLRERALKAVGVSVRLRELVRRRPLALGTRWASWFRDPLESTQLDPWQRFIVAGELAESAAMNLRWEAALGGCTLASPRRRGRAHCDVLPAAGLAWSLSDLAQDGVPIAGGPGRLTLQPPGAEAPLTTAAILLPQGQGWLAGGAVPACPAGRVFPVAPALAAVAALPGCRAATVLVDPRRDGDPPHVVLLLFGPDGVDVAAAWQTLAAELGAENLPDHVAAFPLVPRRDDTGKTAARWCHQQFRDGGLGRKANDELFRLLSQLRARVVSLPKEPA